MSKIVQAVKGALSGRIAPDSLDTRIADGALASSNIAGELLKGSDKNRVTVMGKGLGSLKQGKKLTNQQKQNVVNNLGDVVKDTKQLKFLKPHIETSLKAWEEGVTIRADLATKAAKSAQKVAVVTTKAQAAIGEGHTEAALQVGFTRHAYGGANFSL